MCLTYSFQCMMWSPVCGARWGMLWLLGPGLRFHLLVLRLDRDCPLLSNVHDYILIIEQCQVCHQNHHNQKDKSWWQLMPGLLMVEVGRPPKQGELMTMLMTAMITVLMMKPGGPPTIHLGEGGTKGFCAAAHDYQAINCSATAIQFKWQQ